MYFTSIYCGQHTAAEIMFCETFFLNDFVSSANKKIKSIWSTTSGTQVINTYNKMNKT